MLGHGRQSRCTLLTRSGGHFTYPVRVCVLLVAFFSLAMSAYPLPHNHPLPLPATFEGLHHDTSISTTGMLPIGRSRKDQIE